MNLRKLLGEIHLATLHHPWLWQFLGPWLMGRWRAAQSELTHNFLAYKMGEHEKLSAEIDRVHQKNDELINQ